MRIVFGIMGILLGFVMIRYFYQIRPIVGTWDWAEKLFSTGGTYTGIKVVGIVLIIISFIYMTGTTDILFQNIFSKPISLKSI